MPAPETIISVRARLSELLDALALCIRDWPATDFNPSHERRMDSLADLMREKVKQSKLLAYQREYHATPEMLAKQAEQKRNERKRKREARATE